jgi:AraC-like DNA-binding protein
MSAVRHSPNSESALHLRFDDSDELARCIQDAQLRASQISKGAFRGSLFSVGIGGWQLQQINLFEGTAFTDGNAAAGGGHGFLIPLRHTMSCRLLGKQLNSNLIAVYAPGSEHAGLTYGGREEIVLLPPKEFLSRRLISASEVADFLPRSGSHLWQIDDPSISNIRALLRRLLDFASRTPELLVAAEVARSLAETLSSILQTAVMSDIGASKVGRPAIARASVVRRVQEFLREECASPVYLSEVCASTDVSPQTLSRIFIEHFGVPAGRYLALKRLYLARDRLRSGRFDTVTGVALSCGFWEPARFSARYRALFGERPSETLRRTMGRTARPGTARQHGDGPLLAIVAS